MRSLVGFLLLSALPAGGAGQTHLRVDVRLSQIEERGDTVRVEFVVRNLPQSEEELFTFTAEAPAPVVHILTPAPRERWATSTVAKGLPVASWGLLGPHLARGATTPPLAFEAVGLPGIVTYYAMGWFPVPKYTPVKPGPPLSPREALRADAVTGRMVGVEPVPNGDSLAALVARLQRLTQETCALGWIADAAMCRSLQAKLDRGDKAQLQAFVDELAAAHGPEPGKPVKEDAYWLLKINADHLLRRL